MGGSKKPTTPKDGVVSTEIKELVQAEVRDQLDRQLTVLREAGGLAIKIVLAAFALLLAIFTIFGLTTWNDVAKQTTEYMKQRVDALIQSNDADTGVRQTLNDLVNRAILAAELPTSHTSPESVPPSLFESDQSPKFRDLPKFEWDRLKAWLKSEKLELQEFQDALAILNTQSTQRKKADANGFLADMLNPADTSDYRWTLRQPDKRIAIMTNFSSPDLGSSAVAIATSTSSEDLRVAAIEYVRTVNYTDGFDKIVALAHGDGNSPVKLQALLTIAKLRPTHPQTLVTLKEFTSSHPNYDSTRTAARIVWEWWDEKKTRSEHDAETQKKMIASSKELLSLAIDGGVKLSQERARIVQSWLLKHGKAYFMWSAPTSETSKTGILSQTPEEFAQLKPYWELLSDAANSADIIKLDKYLYSGSDRFAAKMSLGDSSVLAISQRQATK